jgi:pimeloyl-ACP methyl ester carboxylesterase
MTIEFEKKILTFPSHGKKDRKISYYYSPAKNKTIPSDSSVPLTPSTLFYFLHGFPDNALSFLHQWRSFNENYEILTPNLSGADPMIASNDQFPMTLNDQQEFHRLLLQRFSGRKIVGIGHDIGGFHLDLLLRDPQIELQAAVFINSYPLKVFWEQLKQVSQFQWAKSWYMALFQFPQVAKPLWKWSYQKNLFPVSGLKARLSQGDQSEMIHHYSLAMAEAKNQFFQFLKSKTKFNQIAVPILSLHGTKDQYVTCPTTQAYQSYASDVQIKMLPAGHWMHQDSALLINQEIKLWLDNYLIN